MDLYYLNQQKVIVPKSRKFLQWYISILGCILVKMGQKVVQAYAVKFHGN